MTTQFGFSMDRNFLQGYADYLKKIQEMNPGKGYVVTLSVDLVPDGIGYEITTLPRITIDEVKQETREVMTTPAVRKTEGPQASIWATATDLEGTDYERKKYFVLIEDDARSTRAIVVVGPGPALSIEPYRDSDYGYDEHDEDEDEDDGDYEDDTADEDEYEA